jgi:protein TonB
MDNPWPRLPWVLFSAVLIWGALLWGFGLLLGQMAEEPKTLKPIDAELIEVSLPAKHITVPKPPKPEPIRQATPQAPDPVQQSITQSPSPEQSLVKPIVQTPAPSARPQASSPLQQSTTQPPSQTQSVDKSPAPSPPVVSLPETNLADAGYAGMTQSTQQQGQASNKATSANIQPGFETHARISPEVSEGSITPPQFGGAAYLSNPKPVYPALAKRMGLEGKVRLKVLVSREGSALKIEIAQSSGHEILDKAAAEAVKNWRFTPARQGDSPVDEWVLVPVAFRLKK